MKLKVDSLQRSTKLTKLRKNRRLKLRKSEMNVITDCKNKDYKKVLGTIVCQKLDNLYKMEKFLEIQDLPRLDHKKIRNSE